MIPIIKVDSLSLVGDNTNYRDYPMGRVFRDFGKSSFDIGLDAFVGLGQVTSYDVSNYVIHNRFIELPQAIFPGGSKNIQVEGVFGWVENQKEAATTTAGDLETNDTSLLLTDASDFENGDVVVFGDNLLTIPDILVSGNTISFSSVGTLQATILTGADIVSYGRVPPDIQDLADMFTANMINKWSNLYSNPDTGNIKSEKTDDYSYTLFGEGDVFNLFNMSTMAEEILVRYQAPPYVGIV